MVKIKSWKNMPMLAARVRSTERSGQPLHRRGWQTNHDFYGTHVCFVRNLLGTPNSLPSWKPGFETHLFHTTANEFRLMHSLPRRQMNHGYCPNFHDGKQITRTASFPTCVPYPLERPNWITFLK
ncbi:hypothetical protein BD560DRAFT_428475 [Blakeslea trispora]|nr:hypothetical protein BD560DRAFT_428475 [Blakeslea trispora]